jgi:hypothetical protein
MNLLFQALCVFLSNFSHNASLAVLSNLFKPGSMANK